MGKGHSGVKISDDIKIAYDKMKLKPSLSALILNISTDGQEVILDKEIKGRSLRWIKDNHLSPDVVRYVIYDCGSKSPQLIRWVPTNSSIKMKMLFAASEKPLTSALSGIAGRSWFWEDDEDAEENLKDDEQFLEEQAKSQQKRKLRRCYKYLIHNTLLTDVIDQLVEFDKLSISEKEEINAIDTETNKNRIFLDIVIRKDDDACDEFIKGLAKVDQDAADKILKTNITQGYKPDETSMQPSELKEQIKTYRKEIIRASKLCKALDTCYAEGVFTMKEKQMVEEKSKVDDDFNELFIDTLLTKEDKYCFILLEELIELGHETLWKKLKMLED